MGADHMFQAGFEDTVDDDLVAGLGGFGVLRSPSVGVAEQQFVGKDVLVSVHDLLPPDEEVLHGICGVVEVP
jgi:hypothetical protein